MTGFPDPALVRPLVQAALAEDVGTGDVTSEAVVPPGQEGEGVIVAHEAGVLCGLPVARETFHAVDPGLVFEADAMDGDPVEAGTRVARIRGRARSILTAERTALNFLQHLSGIATATRRAAARLEGTGTRVLDTRKTVPGLRLLAKYAVRCGGGVNHRVGLYDMVLIKENHIAAGGGVRRAVEAARRRAPTLKLEIEVTNLAELEEAVAAGPDRILLDNFEPSRVREAVKLLTDRAAAAGGKAPEVELSGGITPETIRDFAVPGVDYISSGAITHSAPALDLSLELRLGDGGGDA